MGNFEFNKINKGKFIIFTSALILAGFPTVTSAEENDSQGSAGLTAEQTEFSLNDVEGAAAWLDTVQHTDVTAFDSEAFIESTNDLYINFLNDHSSKVSVDTFLEALEKELSAENTDTLQTILSSLTENVPVDDTVEETTETEEEYSVKINKALYESFLIYIEANKDRLSEDVSESTYTSEYLELSQSDSDASGDEQLLEDGENAEDSLVSDDSESTEGSDDSEEVSELEDDLVTEEESLVAADEVEETEADPVVDESDTTDEAPVDHEEEILDTVEDVEETVEPTEESEEATEVVEEVDAPEETQASDETAVETETPAEDAEVTESEDDLETVEEVVAEEKLEESELDTEDSLEEETAVKEEAAVSETVATEPEAAVKLVEKRSFMTVSSTVNVKQQLINAATTGGASSRWHAAIEGYTLYPNEQIFKDQLAFLSKRMLALGIGEHEAENYSAAVMYYNRIFSGPTYLFDTATVNTAGTNLAFAVDGEPIISMERLITRATTGGASSQWHAALEGYMYFPSEPIFREQLQFLSRRMMTFGIQEHEKGNYSGALVYYNRITSGPAELFSTSLVHDAKIYQKQAEQNQRLMTKATLISEATSGGASSRWNAAMDGYAYYPSEKVFREQLQFLSGRMMTFGMQEHEKGNYAGALVYYNRITQGPTELFDSALIRDAGIYSTQAAANQRLMTKQSLMTEATSGGASSQWRAALNGYTYYPSEQLFKDQLKTLSQRMLTFGMQEHEKGNLSGALTYYNRITDGPTGLFDSSLVQDAQLYQRQALNNQRLMTKQSLMNETVSGGASSRWNAAVNGYNYFPNESFFKDQLRTLAARMMELGTQEHRLGNFSAALTYYNRVTQGPVELFDASLMTEIGIYKTQAQNQRKFLSIHSLEYKAQNGDLMSRWQASKQGFEQTKNKTFEDLLRNNSNELYTQAVTLHENGEFKQADALYAHLLTLDKTFDSIVVKARTNKYFAENNLYIVNSVYYSSNYAMSLEAMLDAQMRNNPQTDLYGGGWKTAKREDVRYYLDPTNFIDDFDNNVNAVQEVKVTTSSLNVRSQSSTSGTIIGSVKLNEVHKVSDYQNGWYKISLNGTDGWISGAYVEPIRNVKEFNMETLTAKVNTSVLNVRANPGTSFAVVGQLSLGNNLTIIGSQNEWLNIKYNNITGWVHGDFVNLESTINKDALQFLVLSGNSGISATDLNKELTGKGILAGKGASFIEASQKYNVNEIYLLSHALLETGNGASRLATGILVTQVDGKAVTPKVVYNMYGIGAFDVEPLRTGSEYAYKQGWDTPEKAIIEGAKWISDQYINHATYRQDTLYKMRWNPSRPGVHQYATDIGWAFKQTKSLNYLVEMSQKYNFVLRFDLPTFK